MLGGKALKSINVVILFDIIFCDVNIYHVCFFLYTKYSENIMIVKKFDLNFLMNLLALDLPESENIIFGNMPLCVCAGSGRSRVCLCVNTITF